MINILVLVKRTWYLHGNGSNAPSAGFISSDTTPVTWLSLHRRGHVNRARRGSALQAETGRWLRGMLLNYGATDTPRGAP